MGKKKKLEKKIKNFKILGAKNHRKYLHKHSGPPFQIRGGPGSFSIAVMTAKPLKGCTTCLLFSEWKPNMYDQHCF